MLLLIVALSCRKEGIEDSIIPQIQIINVEPLQVQQFQENVVITIYYKDADGNIGETHPDSASLYIQDSRLEDFDKYHIPPQAPIGKKVSIRGHFIVTINAPFLLGNGGDEKVFYNIKLRDRSGNWSNIESTPKITITK